MVSLEDGTPEQGPYMLALRESPIVPGERLPRSRRPTSDKVAGFRSRKDPLAATATLIRDKQN